MTYKATSKVSIWCGIHTSSHDVCQNRVSVRCSAGSFLPHRWITSYSPGEGCYTWYVSFFSTMFRLTWCVALSVSASATATATLSFRTLPQPTSCASATFAWTYTGPELPLMLQITNIGVPQVAPPSTTASSTTTSPSSTTSRSSESYSTTSAIAATGLRERAPPNIPVTSQSVITLVSNYDPTLLSYIWNTVNVSQGWYVLSATISTVPTISQTVTTLYVHTGSNISCLIGVISPTNSHSPTITRSSLSSQPASSNAAADLSSSHSSRVPTIVGVTVGMAVLLMSLLLLCLFLTRKRKSRKIDGGSIKNSFYRWKGSKDSRGSNVPGAKRYRSSRSHLTSQLGSVGSTFGPDFEDSINMVPEKTGPDEHGVVLSTLPVLHSNPSSRTRTDHTYSPSSSSSNVNEFGGGGGGRKSSSARHSTAQHSIDSSALYPPSSRESGQYVTTSTDVLRSHSLSTTGTQYSSSDPISPPSLTTASSFPPPTAASTTIGNNKQIRRQSVGKKRKPAPVYNPSQDAPLSTSTGTESSSSGGGHPQLSHKDSFGPGGIEGKPLHYLIPDMPLSQSWSFDKKFIKTFWYLFFLFSSTMN